MNKNNTDFIIWKLKEHSRIKHILLEKYLKAWITILGKYNNEICYFDGFAGPGEYTGGVIGSPIIALRIASKLDTYFNKMICVFIEKDKKHLANLKNHINRIKQDGDISAKIKISFAESKFEDEINEIFNTVGEGNLIPSFFFIDPFGYNDTPFNTIKKIMNNDKTEIFFTFMVRDVNRFIEARNEEIFNKLFGTDDWKKAIKNSNNREQSLINLYLRQLHESAKIQYSNVFKVCATERCQTLYYLIHATNNLKGHIIMKDIMYNLNESHNFAYLGPEDAFNNWPKLFSVYDTEEVKNYLLNKFRNKKLSFESIIENVCSPWEEEPPYIEKNYRAALKKLEQEKIIQIERITSKTSKGLSGKDFIIFP